MGLRARAVVDGCSTAAPDPPSACHARWCATEGASGVGGISTGGSRPARETGIGRARGICDDGSVACDRCPHGTAARHPPLLCHCRGMERGVRGVEDSSGGRETTLHTCRGDAPPVTARRGESSATGGARSSAVLGWARRRLEAAACALPARPARGSRGLSSSVSRECASACECAK